MLIETFFNNQSEKRFFFPGKIFSGEGISARAVDLISNCESVAIVVDHVFADSHLCKKLQSSVGSGRAYTWVIQGAPYVQDVAAFIEQMGEMPAAIVSIGGGSASDFAKSIILHELYGSLDGVGVGQKLGLAPRSEARCPLYVAIPTTAGSGAEASRYYVIYDKKTGGKVYGKSWQIIADWIFLDPNFLRSAPETVLLSCGFDVFVHLFETLICRYEKSWIGQMLSVACIARLMSALEHIHRRKKHDASHFNALLECATFAGMAISNVRTGHIHEAAGALLEVTTLNHPETLFVFFRDAVAQYQNAIGPEEQMLLSQLRTMPDFTHIKTMEDIIVWWERLFVDFGLVSKIKEALQELKVPLADARQHIFERVFSDKVWVDKECPVKLESCAVSELIQNSFVRFGRLT